MLSVLVRRFMPIIAGCAAELKTDTVLDFGPVDLPGTADLRIVQADRKTWPNTNQSMPALLLAVSCFALSRLSPDQMCLQLNAMHAAAPFMMLADFKTPERNIEAPACFLMGGMRHLYKLQGCAFDSFGGLEGLLYAERNRFRVVERHTLLGGALTCILAERIAS